MGEIYGYGCVSSIKISRRDPEGLKRTKAYQALKNQFTNMMLSEDCLHVDLVTATYRVRNKLQNIISSSGYGDCIVLVNISALGFSPNEIKENYLKIYKAGIGLLIPDYSNPSNNSLDPLSTSGWNMCLSEDLIYNEEELPAAIKDRLKIIDSLEVKTNQGRAFLDRPDNFETVYWLYENYFLAEKDTYKNRLISISKKLFNRLATEYEESDPNYYNALSEQDELYNISEKPKRHGSVPDDFEDFLNLVNQGVPVGEAARRMNYTRMNDIDFKRYLIKYHGGKKSMAVANEMRKTDLALKLTKDVIGNQE